VLPLQSSSEPVSTPAGLPALGPDETLSAMPNGPKLQPMGESRGKREARETQEIVEAVMGRFASGLQSVLENTNRHDFDTRTHAWMPSDLQSRIPCNKLTVSHQAAGGAGGPHRGAQSAGPGSGQECGSQHACGAGAKRLHRALLSRARAWRTAHPRQAGVLGWLHHDGRCAVTNWRGPSTDKHMFLYMIDAVPRPYLFARALAGAGGDSRRARQILHQGELMTAVVCRAATQAFCSTAFVHCAHFFCQSRCPRLRTKGTGECT